MAEEDHALVRAVRAGNVEAYRTLVDRHQRRLYAVALRLVGDPGQADEIAQETFVKGFRGLADFREESSFGTWLIQIAIHAARDRKRAARRHDVVSIDSLREARGSRLDPVDTSTSADPGYAVEAEEERGLMRSALASLPPEYREVLVLKHFEGWDYQHIAAVTGDSVGTLKVRAYRARHVLRQRLIELGWGAGNAREHLPAPGPDESLDVGDRGRRNRSRS